MHKNKGKNDFLVSQMGTQMGTQCVIPMLVRTRRYQSLAELWSVDGAA